MERSEEYYDRLVDEDALAAYLEAELGDADEFTVRRHAAGHSNETLFVTWGDRDLVLRRPPPGETADRAHDVLREYRVLDALQDTSVPVPTTVRACDDESVLGSDFYVMNEVEGDVFRDEEPTAVDSVDDRTAVGEALVDTLAAIHDVDYAAVGLEEFGYPEGFTERQVRRWSEQLTWALSKTADEREVPDLYDVMEWLQNNAPEEHPHTLVHGDYKLDNVAFAAPGGSLELPPRIAAVYDWEMSTLGDPLTDLGWLLSFWRDPHDPEPVVPELTATFMAHEHYPTRRDLIDRWESATGLTYENDRFYRTLAVYKLCGLGEMFFARHLQGDADDPLYPEMRDGVPALAQRAKRIIDGEEPL